MLTIDDGQLNYLLKLFWLHFVQILRFVQSQL